MVRTYTKPPDADGMKEEDILRSKWMHLMRLVARGVAKRLKVKEKSSEAKRPNRLA